MANPYQSSRGITINGKHSYRDFSLVPAARPVLGEAPVDTSFLKVPGAHGSLDLTESLTGYPVYDNREGSWSFYIAAPRRRWDVIRTEFVRRYHGQAVTIIQDKEPDVYLSGRCWVEDPDKRDTSEIVLGGAFYPYKYDLRTSDSDWLWDPFSFETGIVREYGGITVNGSATVEFVSSPLGGSPEIRASAGGMTVTVDGAVYDLTTSYKLYAGIVLPPDYSTVSMTFTGTGTVDIRYRGGRL